MKGVRIDPRKAEFVKKYDLTFFQARKLIAKKVEQLAQCKNEAARRVLLGIGRKKAA